MKVTIDVSPAKVCDLLCSGIEGGGSNYWATLGEINMGTPDEFNPNLPEYLRAPFNKDGYVQFIDEEADSEETYKLDRPALERGLQVMADKHPVSFGRFMNDDYDSTAGDIFIQCCLFGEMKYG